MKNDLKPGNRVLIRFDGDADWERATLLEIDGKTAQVLLDRNGHPYFVRTDQLKKMSGGRTRKNPLLTRSEKKRFQRKIKRGIAALFSGSQTTKEKSAKAKKAKTFKSWTGPSSSSDPMVQEMNRRMRESVSNPGEDRDARKARQVFKEFHGTESSGRIIELENDLVRQKKFALLARMYGFDMKNFPRYYAEDSDMPSGRRQEPNLLLWADNILLCSDVDKSQLFLWGGNQNLEPLLEKYFGVESSVQLVILGEIERIWYVTKKAMHGHNPEKYVHKFGEACKPTCPVDHEHRDFAGEMPLLVYDRRNRHQFIVGGDYTITPEGIAN